MVTARKSSRWCMPSFVLDQPCHLRAAVPVHRTRHNAGHLLVHQLRPAELLASQLETFNFRAFNGLVTSPLRWQLDNFHRRDSHPQVGS